MDSIPELQSYYELFPVDTCPVCLENTCETSQTKTNQVHIYTNPPPFRPEISHHIDSSTETHQTIICTSCAKNKQYAKHYLSVLAILLSSATLTTQIQNTVTDTQIGTIQLYPDIDSEIPATQTPSEITDQIQTEFDFFTTDPFDRHIIGFKTSEKETLIYHFTLGLAAIHPHTEWSLQSIIQLLQETTWNIQHNEITTPFLL
jgi:hypothetical protein